MDPEFASISSNSSTIFPFPFPFPFLFLFIFFPQLPVKVPLTLHDDDVGEPSLTRLIKRFKENTMTIFNAILSEKRVLFLGYNHPAGEVS